MKRLWAVLILAALLMSGCTTTMLCDELSPKDRHPLCIGIECAWPYQHGKKVF